MRQVADEALDQSDAQELEQLRAVVAARGEEAAALDEKRSASGRRVRSAIIGILTVNGILLTFVIVGAMGDTEASPPLSPQAPAAEDRPAADEGERAGSSVAAPPPVSSGRSTGSRSSGQSLAELYVPTGGLQDIFCRPRGGETEETWRGRVAQNCEP